MRRRHKIISVHLWSKKPGFSVKTKSGWAAISLNKDKPLRTDFILRRFFPHIIDELIQKQPQCLKELKAILLGRYIYGKVIEREYVGCVMKVLI